MKKSKAPKKGLQKLPNESTAVLELLKGATITKEQLNQLNRSQVEELNQQLTERFNTAATALEKEKLWQLIEPIATEQTKNDYWEANHQSISAALSNYINTNHTLPTKTALSGLTGLSRQTIHKHFKEYKQAGGFKFQQEAFELLTNNLLARLYGFACSGNVQAAKLFLELSGVLAPTAKTTTTNTTNNFIQINNTLFSLESLKQLSPERLAEVEKLLHRELSK